LYPYSPCAFQHLLDFCRQINLMVSGDGPPASPEGEADSGQASRPV
jgi:hypothetical protein